jgi:hypothetical protein
VDLTAALEVACDEEGVIVTLRRVTDEPALLSRGALLERDHGLVLHDDRAREPLHRFVRARQARDQSVLEMEHRLMPSFSTSERRLPNMGSPPEMWCELVRITTRISATPSPLTLREVAPVVWHDATPCHDHGLRGRA